MLGRTRVIAVAISIPALAVADDPRGAPDGYVASGPVRGQDQYDYLGFILEAGRRIESTPLFGRLFAQTGTNHIQDRRGLGRGTYIEGRAGLEARTCRRDGMFCAALGIDVGRHRGRFEPRVDYVPIGRANKLGDTEPLFADFDSTVVAPRLTLDGGARIRARLVVEMPRHFRKGAEDVTGTAVSLALGVAF
jgi:hypothetical protein